MHPALVQRHHATTSPGRDNEGGGDVHLGRQLATDPAIGVRRALDKNTKARLDAELLRKRFAGIASHRCRCLTPAAAAPTLDPGRDAGAACRPAAPPRCAAWSAPAPTRGS